MLSRRSESTSIINVDLARHVNCTILYEQAQELPELEKQYKETKKKAAEVLQRFTELRNAREQRRLQAYPSVTSEDPILQGLRDIAADAAKEAEVRDRVREHIEMPDLPKDSSLQDLVEERLERARARYRELVPARRSGSAPKSSRPAAQEEDLDIDLFDYDQRPEMNSKRLLEIHDNEPGRDEHW